MGSKEKGLVLFIFLFILHMFSAHGEQGISANVTETAMDTIRPNATLSKNEGSKAIISVSKRGSSGGGTHGGFGGFHGSSSGGFRGGNPGSGKSFGGGDNGGSASKSPRTPGSLIPVYGGVAGAAAAARHNNHHSGASGPNQNQVGFGVVRVAILCPLVLMLCSLWS